MFVGFGGLVEEVELLTWRLWFAGRFCRLAMALTEMVVRFALCVARKIPALARGKWVVKLCLNGGVFIFWAWWGLMEWWSCIGRLR